jgi:hypothetical protein
MLSMTMIFTPEQQIFMTEPYFSNGDTLHTFRESDKCSAEVLDLKFVLRKILTVKRGRRTPIISQATVAAD